jgi:hypothetical protein
MTARVRRDFLLFRIELRKDLGEFKSGQSHLNSVLSLLLGLHKVLEAFFQQKRAHRDSKTTLRANLAVETSVQ